MEIFVFALALTALVMTVFSLVHEYRVEEAELRDLEDRVLDLRRQADALCGGYRPSSH